MPPEPLPWDRRDFVFRERKHYGGPALGGGGSSSSTSAASRWGDSCHGPRDSRFSSPRRPPSVYYKHGSCYNQLFTDEPGGRGCNPSRSDGDNCRSYTGRYGGGSGRINYSRDGRGYFRRPSWDFADLSRQHHEAVASGRRSVADPSSSSHLSHLKDHHDKTGGDVGEVSRTGRRYDRDREGDGDSSLGSIAWRPLKWVRSGSFSSSSKVLRSKSDKSRPVSSFPHGRETPVRSPMASPLLLGEDLQKKQRLGWGQGLAKFEKKKVEGPEGGGGNNELVHCSNSAKASFSDTNPKFMTCAGSASPVTPSSIPCSSSMGMEDKPYTKATNNDTTSNFSNSPGHGLQNCLEDFSFTSKQLVQNSLSDIGSLLSDLLQAEDACTTDSNFTRQTAMTKLLLLKNVVLKVLEKTDSEIELFENELKNLNSDCGRSGSFESSSELQVDIILKPSEEPANTPSKLSTPSSPLKGCLLTSSVGQPLQRTVEEVCGEAKEQDIDSPETVTPKFGKTTLMEKGLSYSHTVNVGGYLTDVKENSSTVSGAEHVAPVVNGDTLASVFGNWNGPDLVTKGVFNNSGASLHTNEHCSITSLIVASNKDFAKNASEVFNKLLSADSPPLVAWGSENRLSYKRRDLHIKEKLTMRKHFLKFKERVLMLKFKTFQHLWKEDLWLLSTRKQRSSKSQKHFELKCRFSQNESQKLQSSMRPRFALPGNPTLVPTTEIVDFTSKLLLDFQIKHYRNNLKMPALILDERERRHSRFITNNGLIEDPCSFEKERAMINPWTPQEKEVFMEMLATFGKDFSEIALFLSHKTTADCIEFYYKNHKSESFIGVKKSLDIRKQQQYLPTNNYLVTSEKKWQREMNVACLDMLGSASMIAVQASNNRRVQQKSVGRSSFGGQNDFKMSRGDYTDFERARGYERNTTTLDALAGICGTLSSEVMCSCVTASVDTGYKMNSVTVDQPLASEVTHNIDEEDVCSDEGCGYLDFVDWTDTEKFIFVRALSSYGRDFSRISHCVGTKSREQCKTFFSKARKSLGLDVMHQVLHNGGGGTTSNGNGGRRETDDACVVEMDSASAVYISREVFGQEGIIPLQTSPEKSAEQNEVGVLVSNQEGIGTMAEKLVFTDGDDKISLRKEVGPQLDKIQEKTAIVALGSNGSPHLNEAADLFPDLEAKEHGNEQVSFPVESVSIMELSMVDRSSSHDASEAPQEDAVGFCHDDFKAELEPHKFLVPETGLDNKKQPRTCADADQVSSPHGFAVPEPATANCPENNVNFCPSINFRPSYRHQIMPGSLPCNQKKPQIISWQQKEKSTSLPVNSLVPDTSPIYYEDHNWVASLSTLNFEEHGDKRHQSSTSGDIDKPHLLVKQHSHLGPGLPYLLKSNEGSGAQRRPPLQITCTETEGQSVRTGDVKLFGQILSHPSPTQESSCSHESDDKPPSSKQESFGLQLPDGGTIGTLSLSRPENST